MLEPLFRPVPFFRALADGRYVPFAVLVVLLTAFTAAMVAFAVAQIPLRVLPDTPLLRLTPVLVAVAAFLSTFGGWLVAGLLARMGAGMEAKPWAVTGYAFLPQVVTNLLAFLLVLVWPVTLPEVAVGTVDLETLTAETARLSAALTGSPMGIATNILGYIGVLWTFILMYLGLRETADATRAQRSVIIIAVLYLALVLTPFLLGDVATL